MPLDVLLVVLMVLTLAVIEAVVRLDVDENAVGDVSGDPVGVDGVAVEDVNGDAVDVARVVIVVEDNDALVADVDDTVTVVEDAVTGVVDAVVEELLVEAVDVGDVMVEELPVDAVDVGDVVVEEAPVEVVGNGVDGVVDEAVLLEAVTVDVLELAGVVNVVLDASVVDGGAVESVHVACIVPLLCTQRGYTSPHL